MLQMCYFDFFLSFFIFWPSSYKLFAESESEIYIKHICEIVVRFIDFNIPSNFIAKTFCINLSQILLFGICFLPPLDHAFNKIQMSWALETFESVSGHSFTDMMNVEYMSQPVTSILIIDDQ